MLTYPFPSTSENVILAKEIPGIYKQKFIYGHLDKFNSRLDSYFIVFLTVWFQKMDMNTTNNEKFTPSLSSWRFGRNHEGIGISKHYA